MGITMKNTRSVDFCAGQIDFITNFAVITNVVIKTVHCISNERYTYQRQRLTARYASSEQ